MTRLWQTAAIVLAGCAVTMGTGWSYSGSDGPSHWKDEYPTCGGSSQSPINIISGSAIEWPTDKSIWLSGYDDYLLLLAPMSNDGHTIKISVVGLQQLNIGDDVYILEQFHFHFGSNSLQGSEHQIDGKSAPMEVHLVHFRSDLGSVENALSDSNGIAVLAFQFQVRFFSNPSIDPIVSMLSEVTHKGDVTLPGMFKLKDIMGPFDFTLGLFFQYKGSLTTPPCSESVLWHVCWFPNYISEYQLEQFRALLSTGADETPSETLADNFRPIQPLNGRPIYRGFIY